MEAICRGWPHRPQSGHRRVSPMADEIFQTSLLSHTPLTGSYRYADLFQLIAPPPEAPRPPYAIGHHPVLLELRVDPRIPPDRKTDRWHRDQWERDRDEKLRPGAPEDWLATYRQSTEWSRKQALVKELTVLLSTLTGYTFFPYNGDHYWFLPSEASLGFKPVWGQTFYSSVGRRRWWSRLVDRLRLHTPTAVAPREVFSEPIGEPAPLVPPVKRGRWAQDAFVVSEPHRMEFPDDLGALLDLYFTLEKSHKEAFYAASLLWVQCSALASKCSSLSLLAAASAVETLVRCDHPEEMPCPECSTPESVERCEKCDAPRYRLASRFKKFFKTHGGQTLGNFADRLYGFRSGISHSGRLLRCEFFDVPKIAPRRQTRSPDAIGIERRALCLDEGGEAHQKPVHLRAEVGRTILKAWTRSGPSHGARPIR